MKRTAIIVASKEIISKSDKALTILTPLEGEDIVLNTAFAKANGISDSFGGIVLYSEEECKAGEEYVDAEGEVGVYTKDFTKITGITKLTGPVFEKKYEEAVSKHFGL